MLEKLDVSSGAEWRSWLEKHHLNKEGVWLVFHRKGSKLPSITYDEAMDEALAYGWIDSVIKKIDDEKYARKFTPRRASSVWSKLNVSRVNRLKQERRMTRSGLEAFEKRTGKVSPREKFNAEGIKFPQDLERAIRNNEVAWKNFQLFTPGYQKRYWIWISTAKNPATRRRRVDEAVVLISRNVKNLLK